MYLLKEFEDHIMVHMHGK